MKLSRGTLLTVYGRYLDHGRVGGPIRPEYIEYDPPIVVEIYATEKALIKTALGKQVRSTVIRCKNTMTGEYLTLIRATDNFEFV
jgi:hypothetical protein